MLQLSQTKKNKAATTKKKKKKRPCLKDISSLWVAVISLDSFASAIVTQTLPSASHSMDFVGTFHFSVVRMIAALAFSVFFYFYFSIQNQINATFFFFGNVNSLTLLAFCKIYHRCFDTTRHMVRCCFIQLAKLFVSLYP